MTVYFLRRDFFRSALFALILTASAIMTANEHSRALDPRGAIVFFFLALIVASVGRLLVFNHLRRKGRISDEGRAYQEFLRLTRVFPEASRK
jgi:pilus assembly protein TadC